MTAGNEQTEPRAGCCAQYRKPCDYHQGYEDAIDTTADPLRAELAALRVLYNACKAERDMWRNLANAWTRSKRPA